MVNRLSPSLAKVISVNTSYQNLVNTDLTDCVSMTNVVDAAVGVEPSITVRDMAHRYAAGTTAGFVVQIDQKELLGLKVVGLPFKIFFYYKGNKQESMDCQQVKGSGSALSLNVINVSGDKATFEVTATSTKMFDEVGICAVEGVSAKVLSTTSLYYAFVGKNGKYYLTSSAFKSSSANALNGYLYDSEHDTTTGGIKDYSIATNFKSNITLGQWPVGKPHNHVAMINDNLTDRDDIITNGERDVWALTTDGSMPFKAGMRAGVEIEKIEVLKALTVSGVHLYQYRPNGSSSDGTDTDGSEGHESTWTDVTPTQAKNFQFLSVNLGFSKQEMSVTADQDFNAIGIKNVGIDLGIIKAYRAFVELPPEVIDDDEPLVISADRSLCDEKQSVTLHSEVPVKWSCSDAHGSTLTFTPDDYATECTVSGFTHADTYIFTATAKDGRTAITKVKYGISREYDLGMKPWVNNFTEKDENGKQIHYTSDMKEYRKKYQIFSADLLPLGGTKDAANIVTPSLDDHATYIGGAQLANDKMIAGVYRDHSVKLTEKTIVGFVTRASWGVADVDLLNGLYVKLYDAGKEVTNVSNANNNFKLLSATVIEGNTKADTEYTLEVDASPTNPVTFDAITLWNKGLLKVGLSSFYIIDAFTETADDATKYQERLDESGEMVSHYTTGARIDESLMNGGSGVEVAQTCDNLANIVDGKTDTYMDFVAPVTAANFVPIPIKLGRRYDAGHQVKLIYSADKAIRVNVGQVVNLVTYLNGKKQETKNDFKIVDANVIGGSDKSEVVWTPTMDFDEISIHLAGVADVAENYKIYGIRIENDADYDGIPDNEDDQSCDNPFLIDEYETSLEKSHDFVNGRMNLRRYMNPELTDKTTGKPSQWFNICLPVNLSFNQFVSTFGNNAELAKPDNFKEKYPKYLHFSIPYVYGNNTLLEAGVPYIIKIDTLNLVDVDDALSEELTNNDPSALKSVYKVQGVDFPMDESGRGIQNILCKQQNTTTKAGDVTWQGGYYKNQIIEKGFYMFNRGVLSYIDADANKVLGLRSWMRETDGTHGAKFSGMDINGTLFGDTTTGINQVNAGEKDNRMFNLQGMRVDNADGKLPEGIYIINGKKVIIK